MDDKDIKQWITVKGNHIPIHEGESVKDAINKRFDDTDDIDIDIELEDEDIKMPYEKRYYIEDMAGYKYLIDESQTDEYFKKGYQIYELDITDEMNQKMNDLIEEYAKYNSMRMMVSSYEQWLKYNTTGLSSSERRLLVNDFRKRALSECKKYAKEYLNKIPKLENHDIDVSYKEANNVGYKESKSKPYGSKEFDWYTSNCQRCIIAYEMRRRGYNVEANKYLGNKDPIYNHTLSLQRAFLDFDSMINEHTYEHQPNGEKYSSRGALIHAMEKDMLKEGEGARFVLSWDWKNARYGHTVNAEVSNGQVIIYDAQNGESHTIKDLIDRKDLRATTLTMCRTDNLTLSNRLEELIKWNH